VAKASLVGLLGPNGAGKTTLLNILNGVTRVQAGRVRVAGHAPGVGGRLAANSSLVPQSCAFYADLTVRENLAFLAGVHGLGATQWRSRLAHCVAVAGLETVLEQRAGRLSGGFQRRVNLALGLVNAPDILYLDEPTVGVDAQSRECIRRAIGALRRDGTTVVYTSHYMEEVEGLCDRLTVIDDGRSVAAGTTAELLARFGDVTTELRLLGDPGDAATALLAPWAPEWLDARTLRLAVASDSASVQAVLATLDQHRIGVEWLRYGADRLDTVYPRLLADGGGEP